MNPHLFRLLRDLEGVGTGRVRLALLAYEKAGEAGLPAMYSVAEDENDAFRFFWDVNDGKVGVVTATIFDTGVVWSFTNWAPVCNGPRKWFSDPDHTAEVPAQVREFIKAHFTQ